MQQDYSSLFKKSKSDKDLCKGDKVAIVDVDTLLIHAALAAQESYITATHKPTGKVKEFPTQTDFYGHWSKRDGGWLAAKNKKFAEKGKPLFHPDEFEIEQHKRLVSSGGVAPEVIAKGRFKSKIEAIMAESWCKDVVICYGRGVNFRYDLAQTQPYKADRPEKPLLYEVVRDYMLKRYEDKMLIVENVETDDVVSSELYRAWVESGRNHDKLKVVGVFCDKDIGQIPCLHYNFNQPDKGVVKITPLEAAKSFAKQLLTGDDCDTIPGLPGLPDEMHTKYGIRRTKGLGAKTAEALIDPVINVGEAFDRVVEAYRSVYGDEKKEFTSFRGDVLMWDWIDHLNERFSLLRMRTRVDKSVPHVLEFLQRVGVKLEE